MKTKFKSIYIIMALFLFLTACSSNEGTNNETETSNQTSTSDQASTGSGKFDGKLEENITIKVLENDTAISKGYFTELLKAFNEEYKEYGIEAVDANVDQYSDLANDGPYGYGPDVLYQANDILMKYSRDKHILPLPIDQIEAISQTPEKAKDAFLLKVDNQEYHVGVPVNVQGPMLYYRQDLLPENWESEWDKNSDSIPDMIQTWNDMYNFSKLRLEEGKYGYMQSLKNVYFTSGFLFSYGGYIFGGDNTDVSDIGFANGDAYKGAKIIQDLSTIMSEEAIEDTITTNAYNRIATGDYFSTISTPDVYTTFLEELIKQYESEGLTNEEADSKAKENLKMVSLPKLPKSGDITIPTDEYINTKSMGGINGYAISSYTKYPNASLEFVKFATSYESIKLRNEILGIAPTREDLIPEISENLSSLTERLHNDEIILMASVPEFGQIWTPLETYFSDIVKDIYRNENEKLYKDEEALKQGLEKANQQIYDAIHTLN